MTKHHESKSQSEHSGESDSHRHGRVSIRSNVMGNDAQDNRSSGSSVSPSPSPTSPLPFEQDFWLPFQDRETELETLFNSLTNVAGDHFYLILAGPQMGKTRLLEQLSRRFEARDSGGWIIRLVNLRKEKLDVRYNVEELLNCFFPDMISKAGYNSVEGVARSINNSDRSILCVLDNAELLDEQCADRFRSYLSQINAYISQGGKNTWLSFVAGSRRTIKVWKGISPAPRFVELSLTHFHSAVVDSILRSITAGRFKDEWYRENSPRLYRATEGLPELLVRYVGWVQAGGFSEMEDIEAPIVFDRLVKPYVDGSILSIDSLIQSGGNDLGRKREILRKVLLNLSPYRLFTYKLLKDVVDADDIVRRVLSEIDWEIDDLWQAIGDTYLMQPVDDPWRVMYPAIRRLLFRYQYVTLSSQADAHLAADNFYKQQLSSMSLVGGKEQSVFVVERLWHQAEYLRLRGDTQAVPRLEGLAADLYRQGIQLEGYSRYELLDYIGRRILADSELHETLSSIEEGLLDRLLP
jgi:hypothetical protein